MSLIPWNPFRDMDHISREMESFMDRAPFGFLGRGNSPRVDVYETKENVVIKAEVPGVAKEDLNIHMDENSIRLSGQAKKDTEFKDEDVYRSERFFGSFSRIIPLPAEVKSDEAKAEYKDGILKISVPKLDSSKRRSRRIDIQ